MKITTNYYEFSRNDFINYTIENLNTDDVTIAYSTYEVINGVPVVIVDTELIAPLEQVTFSVPIEGIYQLKIYYPDIANDIAIDTYSIRQFLDTKTQILSTMRDAICDCGDIDNMKINCIIGSASPIAKDTYDLQLLFNSTGLYRDLLMSPSFLRPYTCIFTEILGNNSTTLLSLLGAAYRGVTEDGVTPNSQHLLRIYTAYLYILFYVFEIDIAEYISEIDDDVTPPDPPDLYSTIYSKIKNPAGLTFFPDETDTDEVIKIKNIFDFNSIMDCYNALSLNPLAIYEELRKLYIKGKFGACEPIDSSNPPDPDDEISDLTYKDHEPFVFMGTTVFPTLYTWNVKGLPLGLTLSDNIGQMTLVPVSGTSFPYPGDYKLNTRGTVIWTLDGSNVTPITMKTDWIYPIRMGDLFGNEWPSSTQILNGVELLGDATNGFIFEPNNSQDIYTWFAVPVIQSILYNQWEDLDVTVNNGIIEGEKGNSFIIHKDNTVGVLMTDGITIVQYYVYKYAYLSHFNNRLKLS